jgi:hypothetical protein
MSKYQAAVLSVLERALIVLEQSGKQHPLVIGRRDQAALRRVHRMIARMGRLIGFPREHERAFDFCAHVGLVCVEQNLTKEMFLEMIHHSIVSGQTDGRVTCFLAALRSSIEWTGLMTAKDFSVLCNSLPEEVHAWSFW